MEPAATPTFCRHCGYPPGDGDCCDRCRGDVVEVPDRKPIRPGAGFAVVDLIHGFVSLFRSALRLAHRREYVGKLAVPVVANLIVFFVVVLLMFWGLLGFFEGLLGTDWGWLDFLRNMSIVLSGVLALALASLSVFLIAPVIVETILTPFLEPLAQATEELHAGKSMRPVEVPFWIGARSGLRSAAQILTIQLVLWIPLLLFSLTGIGAIVAFVVTAWLNALVWFDIPCARRGYVLRDRVELLRRNWARATGFGLAFQVGLFIPFFNFLILTPATAVATSHLYFHFEKIAPRGTVPPPVPEPEPAEDAV